MSLASRQIIKEANRISEKKLKSGFIPMADLILSELNKFYKVTTPGTPSFKSRKQPYRGQWDVDAYNNNLQEIYDDERLEHPHSASGRFLPGCVSG